MGAKRFIAISGNIGSGKTTLTELLAQRYRWAAHYESVADNPYLSDFYGDMPRWSLPLQVFFLSKRFQSHRDIAKSLSSAVQDRSIYEDAHIFARALHESGRMDKRDYESYFALYSTMIEQLQPPDLIVYVRRSVDSIRERIAMRGRAYEADIDVRYLRQLNDCYDQWIDGYKLGKVLTVDGDPLDFRKHEDFDYVCNRIEASLEQPELFTRC